MKGTEVFWRRSPAQQSVWARCALLGLGVLAVAAFLSPLSFQLDGTSGVVAAIAAALVCYTGAALALLLGDRFRGPDLAIVGLLVGILCRTGLPLATAGVIHLLSKTLTDAGLPIYLLVFYLFCLAVETWLSLPDAGRQTSAAKMK